MSKSLKYTIGCFVVLSNYAYGAITVTSITGWNAGSSVQNGKWTGQPDRANTKLASYSNAYKGYYAIDADASYNSYWTINGSGFGTKAGTVTLSFPGGFTGPAAFWVSRTTWTDKKLTVYVGSLYSFRFHSGLWLTIRAGDGSTVKKAIPVVGTIRSRGYGQCTWYVAQARYAASKAIPPTAYTSSSITPDYEPKQWDVINFLDAAGNGLHTAIITSIVSKNTTLNKDGSKTIKYSFAIGEMNVKPTWGEQQSTYVNGAFSVKVSANGTKQISLGILSDYSVSKSATAFYR